MDGMMNDKSKSKAHITFLFPRLHDILFVSIFLSVVILGPRLFNIDGDLGRHLTLGSYILQKLTIPTHDIFSHTMVGAPLTPHEWIPEVLYAASYEVLGLNGVVILSALIIAIAFILVYRDASQRSSMRLVSVGLAIWAAMASSLHWLARPHLFTFLLIVIWTERLERVRRGDHVPLWHFILIMLLWVNMHGAFIAGFVVWGAYLAGWFWDCRLDKGVTNTLGRKLIIIGGLSFLTTLFNPGGWRLWATSLGYILNRYLVSHTAEYLPPDFHQPGTWPFVALLALTIFILSRSQRRMSASHTLLLAGWTVMSLYSVRNIPLYSLVAVPILAESLAAGQEGNKNWQFLEKWIQSVEKNFRGYLWPLASVILVIVLLMSGVPLDSQRKGNQFDPSVFPVQAVNWLESHPQEGNMFNYFTWGGYLLYRTWPDQRVFIDGQTDFYGETLVRQYEKVLTLSEGWEDVLAQYQVQWVIVPTNADLTIQLQGNQSWQTLYSDDTATIMRSRSVQSASDNVFRFAAGHVDAVRYISVDQRDWRIHAGAVRTRSKFVYPCLVGKSYSK